MIQYGHYVKPVAVPANHFGIYAMHSGRRIASTASESEALLLANILTIQAQEFAMLGFRTAKREHALLRNGKIRKAARLREREGV